jgi:hypothetical protein
MKLLASFRAGAGHALAEPAFFKEIALETSELLVEQVVGLVNKTDENVGDALRRASLENRTYRTDESYWSYLSYWPRCDLIWAALPGLAPVRGVSGAAQSRDRGR